MKLHAHRDHADYHPVAMHAKVLLDGQELRLCIHADEEAGTVERAQQDAAGKLIIVGDEVDTEILRGDVRIEVPAEHQWMLDSFPFGPISKKDAPSRSSNGR